MESTERDFEAYGTPLEKMTEFKYLGRLIKAVYYDWPAVVYNLQRVGNSWGRLSRRLSLEGGGSEGVGTFF